MYLDDKDKISNLCDRNVMDVEYFLNYYNEKMQLWNCLKTKITNIDSRVISTV